MRTRCRNIADLNIGKEGKVNTATGFYSTFKKQLGHCHPHYILVGQIQRNALGVAFQKPYADVGRPATPIRLMVTLPMVKHIRNLSNESMVKQWMENVYYQYFPDEKSYACGVPCEASEMVHFHKRINQEGMELILKESIRVNGTTVMILT